MAGGRARVHARLAVEADGREALEKSAEAFRSYERGCRLFPDGKCKNAKISSLWECRHRVIAVRL
jgi:hypothetical protein